MDQISERLAGGLLLVLVLVSATVCYPWDLSRRRAHVVLALPLLGAVVACLYEIAMRSSISSTSVPIRLDLVIVVPATVLCLVMGVLRLAVHGCLKHSRSARSGRLEQVAALLIAASLAYWISRAILK